MRHPSVQHLVDLLEPNSNLPEELHKIANRFAQVRDDVLGDIKEDNPEVAAGLRKLLEAKDCFVRAGHLVSQQVKEVVHDATNDPAPESIAENVTPDATPSA